MEETLLYNFDESVENFFAWLKLCCGYEEESKTYQTLEELIKTQSELDHFIENFYDGDFDLWRSTKKLLVYTYQIVS